MINFTQAFDSAWERMHVILFRPFDFGKWCAIGLSAFLAGLLQGGNGVSGSFNSNPFRPLSFNGSAPVGQQFSLPQIHAQINHAISNLQLGIGISFAVLFFAVIFAIVFAFILLIYWLGARGQFLFLDNVVRNRGAVAWPWQFYARQANSLFGFYALVVVLSFAVIIPIFGVGIVMALPLFRQHRWPVGDEIAGFFGLGLVYFAVAVVVGVVMFIFREFGIPIMFRQGLLARPAFMESLKLIRQYPGSIAVFILLRFAIFVAVVVLSLILCCVTVPCCCLSQLPYLGTVLLLPVLVYVRCFSLDCLAQLGPEYNVWTVDVPPAGAAPIPPPFTPPPPLG